MGSSQHGAWRGFAVKSEKWVAVHVDSYQEVDQVVGIFENDYEAKAYISENHYYGDGWVAVRIERPEYDKWA